MAVRDGLLVLLGSGPKHGYQLKVEFEGSTGQLWNLNVGQVYTTLQRLERDGLVELHETDAEGRSSYRLTEAGRSEAFGWFTTPASRADSARDEVVMKVLLAVTNGIVPAAEVIDTQRAATMAALQDYTRLKSEAGPDQLAWLLNLDRHILRCEAELRWLDRTEERLAAAGIAIDRPALPTGAEPAPATT